MKKEKRKPMHLTLSEEFNKEFEKFCKERDINKSRLIEWLLVQHIQKGGLDENN